MTFISKPDVLREHNEMKEEIKNPMKDSISITMKTYCVCCKRNTATKNFSVRKTK